MKNSKRTPRTLKGAVLIMVMTVMFVLIFLLAGTIAVVYSAHNRAMVKYEESQAYYTARSTLDAYLEAFLKDNTNRTGTGQADSIGTTAVPYYYLGKDPATGDPQVDTANCKQGRALEMDIYSMYVSVAPEGTVSGAAYPYNGSEPYWTVSTDEKLYDWVKQYILDLATGGFTLATGQTLEQYRAAYAASNPTDYQTARALAMKAINPKYNDFKHDSTFYTNGGSDSQDVETSGISNINKFYEQFCPNETDPSTTKPTDTVYYRVPAGTFNSFGESTTGGSYGKVADTFADNATDAIIKVQLLERTMHLKDGDDFKMKFDSGNREKDHIKVQVTVEVILDGMPTTTSVVYANKYDPKPSNQDAVTATGGIGSATSGFPISGGMTSLDGTKTLELNAAHVSGPIFAEGNLRTFTGGTIKLFEGDNYTAIHDFIIRNDMTFNALGDKTFIYVGGQLKVENGFAIGSAGDAYETDLVVNHLNWSSNDLKVTGNIYANTIDVSKDTNYNKVKVGGIMYTNDLITTNDNNGNGTKILETPDVNGKYVIQVPDDGFCDGKINITDRIIYKNYYGGNDGSEHPDYNSDDDKLIGITNKDLVIDIHSLTQPVRFVKKSDNSVESDMMLKSVTPVKINYNDMGAFTFGTDYKKTFTMPDGKKIVVDTHQSKFEKYYDKECFNDDSVGGAGSFKDEFYTDARDESGNLILDVNGNTMKVLDQSKLKNSTEIESAEDVAKKEANALDGCVLPSGSQVISANSTVSAGNYILEPGNVGNLTVDTSGGKVVIQLKDTGMWGGYSGTVNVTGNGELKILVPTGATVGWGTSGGGFKVTYEATMANGNSLYVGDCPAGIDATVPPNIDVYAGKGSTITVNEGGSVHSLLTGYIYGPTCDVQINMAKESFSYTKDGQTVGSAQYFVVGSVLCGEYTSLSSDASGVSFIDRDASTKKPGEVNFAWTDVYFQRGGI